MDAAIPLMSKLSLAARAAFEKKFENIEVPALALSSDFTRSLSHRMPTSPLPIRIMVTSTYMDYRSQAQKLELEADEWDVKYAWHMHDWAARQLPGLGGDIIVDPRYQRAQVLEIIEQGFNDDAERLGNNLAVLRAMHQILIADIRVFEVGDQPAIEALMTRDEYDLQALERWNTKDVEIQEELSDLWDHLLNDEERMLRLRLIGVITRQQQNTEKATVRETQMSNLLQGMQTLDIEENRRVVARNQEATYVAKSELSDLISELEIEAEQAGTVDAGRTREMWRKYLMVYH